jgi:hypothetical protein
MVNSLKKLSEQIQGKPVVNVNKTVYFGQERDSLAAKERSNGRWVDINLSVLQRRKVTSVNTLMAVHAVKPLYSPHSSHKFALAFHSLLGYYWGQSIVVTNMHH